MCFNNIILYFGFLFCSQSNTLHAIFHILILMVAAMPKKSKKNKQRKDHLIKCVLNENGDIKVMHCTSGEIRKRDEIKKILHSMPIPSFLDAIRQGVVVPEGYIIKYGDMTPAGVAFRRRLVEGGLIASLLHFVNQGNDKEFSFNEEIFTYPDSKIAPLSPGYWFCTMVYTAISSLEVDDAEKIEKIRLENSLEEDDAEKIEKIRLEIAAGIGPVVKCLCNDIRREFFQSNRHWYLSVGRFLQLIEWLTRSRGSLEVLVKHNGLLEWVAQCPYWRTHRSDIMQGFKQFKLTSVLVDIESCARRIMDNIVYRLDVGLNNIIHFDERGKTLIKSIALTPIVSHVFDPTCDTQFVVGLLDVMQAKRFAKMPRHEKDWYLCIAGAIMAADCVDKILISKVIEGGSSTPHCIAAGQGFAGMAFDMLSPRSEELIGGLGYACIPNDSRYATAINNGLFEMCLKLLARHGGKESSKKVVDNVEKVVFSARDVALLNKSSKAIRDRRAQVVETLQLLEPIFPKNDKKCKELVQIIGSIVGNVLVLGNEVKCSGKEPCQKCNKELEKSSIKQCERCKQAFYCSKSCQEDDWATHRFCCKTLAANAAKVKEDGGKKKDVKQFMVHLENIKEVGHQAILEKIHKVLVHAVLKDYNILNSVVVVDLHLRQNKMTLMLPGEFLDEYRNRLSGDVDNAKDLFVKHRAKGNVVCAYRTPDAFAISYIDKSLAPWGGSWPASVNEMRSKLYDSKWFEPMLHLKEVLAHRDNHFIETIADSNLFSRTSDGVSCPVIELP